MTRRTALRPAFVAYIPEKIEEGVLYVSVEHRTVVHKCCCGCGNEVVTPLDPTQWKLIYDGRVSLEPSVGSWNLACRSHYWIKHNAVRWAEQWSDARIAAARSAQRQRTLQHYAPTPSRHATPDAPTPLPAKGLWKRFWNWLRG
jgi:hypothetical protein